MDLSDMDSVAIDRRGHRWIQTSISKNEQELLEQVRKDWETVSDDAILDAKIKITGLFGDNANGIRGQACSNFIYLFSNDGVSHYFVCTDTNKEQTAIKRKGECDMYFNPNADFDYIVMQQQLGL